MTQPLNLALTLSLNDRLVGPLQRSIGEMTKALNQLSLELANISKSGAAAAQGLGKVGEKGQEARKAATELRGIASAANEAEVRVGRLHASFGQLTNMVGKAGALFGGFKAAQAVLADPRARAQSYELSLAKLSNVLYNEKKSVAGRQAGQGELDASVRIATLQGVTREEALAGLRVVGAAGGIDRKDAMAMLPTLAKFSVAGEASMEDMAALAVKSMKGYGIKPEQLPKILEMALVSGQMGNFEFKDMAKWLPQQMAMSKSMLGMSGMADFGKLLAVNQMAVNTAGGSQEAGNNVVNFLGKINSSDTQRDFKTAGIDLSGTLAKARGQGIDPIDAFLDLMERQFSKDKGYTALQQRLKAARAGGDKAGEASTLEAMRGIFAGSVMGKFLQDRQAQMGMVGVLNDRPGMAQLQREAQSRAGEADLSQQVLLSTAAMKNTIADSAKQARQYDALRAVNQSLADHRMKLVELSVEYPKLAASMEAVSLAAKAAAAGMAVFGLGNLVTNAVTGTAGGAAGGALGGALTGGAVAGGLARAAGAAGLAGVAGYGAGTLLYDKAISGTSFADSLGKSIAQVVAFMGSSSPEEALAAKRQLEAAEAMMQAADKWASMKIGVSTDHAAFSAEIMDNVARQARRQ